MAEGLNVCPLCGYAENTPPKEIYHMHPGTILHKKYIVGKVLGYGGFGVTYIGWDYALNRKVAIKEFLPGEFSTRMPGETIVTVYDGEATAQFEAGLGRFIDEARRLASFGHVRGIVDIYDTFIENNTGYITMQYLDGCTVKTLMNNGVTLSTEFALHIIKEVLRTLKEIHRKGIIHRDVSPDNIFITRSNEVKLIDFGAARYATAYHSRGLSVILKPGYAPAEQYTSRGNQGPWSDVYATAATLYKMITGITIDESMERMVKDTVKPPREYGAAVSDSISNAIMNALNVYVEARTQSAEEFLLQLERKEVHRKADIKIKSYSAKMPMWLKLTGAFMLTAATVFALLIATGTLKPQRIFYVGPVADSTDRVPYVINHMLNEGRTLLDEKGFAMQISSKEYDEFARKDIIKSQTPDSGVFSEKCALADNNGRPVVYVTVSGGHAPVVVPDVSGLSLKEATRRLNILGFKVVEDKVYVPFTLPDTVVGQDVANIEYAYGSDIILYISSMNDEKENKKKLEEKKKAEIIVIPDVKYMDEAEAVHLLQSSGALVEVRYEQSDKVKSGKVIRQTKTGIADFRDEVCIYISTGFKNMEKEKRFEHHKKVDKIPDEPKAFGSAPSHEETYEEIRKALEEAAEKKLAEEIKKKEADVQRANKLAEEKKKAEEQKKVQEKEASELKKKSDEVKKAEEQRKKAEEAARKAQKEYDDFIGAYGK